MIPYRVKQFYWAVMAITKKDKMDILNTYLNKNEIEIFMKLSKAERQHCIRVFNNAKKYTSENKINIDENKLARCALLHDIGKSIAKINIIEKSIVIILKYITGDRILKYNKRIVEYYKHAEIGGEILLQLGESDNDIITCVVNHHNKEKSIDNIYLQIIYICDDLS